MSTLKAVLNWAADTYQVDGKPLIAINPVKRQNQRWHYIPARDTVIPNDKLANWYHAVMSLTATTPRDLLLVAMFAGLCHADTINLTWGDVDLENKIVSVRTKHGRLHRLPMSDFLFDIFRRRYQESKSQYVFPGRAGGPIRQFSEVLEKAWQSAGFHFTIQELRRTFLATAESLDLPLYAVRALSNRSQRKSQFGSHEEFDVNKLRLPMQRITDRLIQMMGVEDCNSGLA
jgi:integrase